MDWRLLTGCTCAMLILISRASWKSSSGVAEKYKMDADYQPLSTHL